MGLFKNAFKKAVKKQIRESLKKAEQEKREKQELSNKMKGHAKLQSQQLLKIVSDCVQLVNTTVNPEVFFSRYNLMLENLEQLAGLECTGIFEGSKELPSDAFLRVESQFDTVTNAFLNRSFEKAKTHAETLKTDSGKLNTIKRYFDNMEKYTIHMSNESREHFNKMKETYLKD